MVQLLHLSDLHFGPHSRFHGEDPARLGKAFHRALVDAGQPDGFEGKVDLVIVTGDVAETAKQKEFTGGAAFLTALAGELGLPHERFVFVPGNHDVSWPACKIVEAEQEDLEFDDDEFRRRLDEVKLQRYHSFVREFYGNKTMDEMALHLGRGAYLYSFSKLRLSVAALNSCEVESHRPGDHRGLVSREQAQTVMDAWRGRELAGWLKVVTVHHNPVATVHANVAGWREYLAKQGSFKPEVIASYESDVVGFEGREHLKAIVEDCHVQLVLHGHHHAKDEQSFNWKSGGRAHVLSAGSLTLKADKLPKDEPASARLIRLDPEARSIEARSFVYLDWARTVGEVKWGGFVPDPAEPDGYRHALDLPPGFEASAPAEPDDVEETTGVDPAFVRTYRDRLRAAFSRWDLAAVGVTQSGGAGKPIEATLDDMYLPLRFSKTFDINKTDQGAQIGPRDLLGRNRPLVIRGPGGSGKTTWMRWTFRRLLALDRVLPLMLVLRDLSRRWQDPSCMGEERSLDVFLDGWVAEHVGMGWEGALKGVLEAKDGPLPVLLVDGWDELGDLGEEVRRKLLGFKRQFPRIQVVVSSRPYGEGRPSHSEGFDVLDIQPLADQEIVDLTQRFFARCYGEDKAAATKETVYFRAALGRSPEAQVLARTALLLTMMLLISRSRPLPDKRHLLYEACVENLLTALPDRKEQEGAQLQREQWRPDDSEERMRVAAALAHAVQELGYKGAERSSIVRAWDDMAGYLPEAWSRQKKMGFLAWMVGPAALLVDRADGTLAFTHLSFQEFLTAWHLNANTEGAERAEAFVQHLESTAWWETLLLWSALIERQSRERLEAVLRVLSSQEKAGVALVGMMLADGLGSDEAFARWQDQLAASLSTRWYSNFDLCARAWAASRQEERLHQLGTGLEKASIKAKWLGWLSLSEFSETALSLGLPAPRKGHPLVHSLVTQVSHQQITDEPSLAAGRVLCGAMPIWPIEPVEIGLLHSWPGYRRYVGLRLQAALTTGLENDDLEQVASRVLVEPEWNEEKGDLARYLANHLIRDWSRDWSRDWARDWARDLARNWVRDWAHGGDRLVVQNWTRDWARYWTRYWDGYQVPDWTRDWGQFQPRDWARDWARDLGRFWAHDLERYLTRDLDRDLAHDWGIENDPWVAEFALFDLWSLGRSGARASLALTVSRTPETRLLSTACRVSLRPQDYPLLHHPLGHYDGDPLWPALARHLARHSTDADRELLTDLARHPEKREPPLSWGLQYIVRGDLMLDDGSVVTLDKLCDELGLPHLPYLEDLPDELEL